MVPYRRTHLRCGGCQYDCRRPWLGVLLVGSLARHRGAVTSNAELIDLRERLAAEDENWRRIDAEIAQNRAIVSAR